ncbi:MAG: SUMF1/EgtB/PvdO family nonheme iron enzyme [Verrucomicrobiae bacterium]
MRFLPLLRFLGAICALCASGFAYDPISIEMAIVGNAGNRADQNYGYGAFGSVGYDFAIGKYEVTNFQYAAFLTAVASVEDTYSLFPATENPSQPNNVKNIAHSLTRGITQSGIAGSYSYAVSANMENKPANFMTWFSAARFVNWMANGQPTGNQTLGTTENGAYALNGAMSGNLSLTRNVVNPNTSTAITCWIPSEDEWYKAAFYDPEALGGLGDYWLYPTRSDALPTVAGATATGDISNPGANVANYASGSTWNGQIENLTTVGSAGALSTSAYGTYDQGGNLWEWSEGLVKTGTARGLRQGSANDPAPAEGQPNDYLAASWDNNGQAPENYFWNAGIRIAGIPEPSTVGLALLAASMGLVAWKLRG